MWEKNRTQTKRKERRKNNKSKKKCKEQTTKLKETKVQPKEISRETEDDK